MKHAIDNFLVNILQEIYQSMEHITLSEKGAEWVPLTNFGNMLSKRGIKSKMYGYPKLMPLIEATSMFEIYHDKSVTPPIIYIRSAVNHNLKAREVNKIEHAENEKDSLIKEQLYSIPDLGKYYKQLIDDAEFDPHEIVGFYEKNEKGQYLISDVRDLLFHEHIYPTNNNVSDREITILLDEQINHLKLNSYYCFNWKIDLENNSRGYKLNIDRSKNPRPIDPIDFTNNLHKLWDDRSHGPAMKSAMDTVSSELMASSDGTFIYELLQNANDYPRQDENGKNIPVEVEFHVTDKYLICRHNGAKFTPKDVASICSIGHGSKTKNKNTIGYKGIGFKTVFHAHDWVYIQTGRYMFRFDKEHEKEGRPFQIMPVWTTIPELTEFDSTVAELIKDGLHKFNVQTVMLPRKHEYLYGMDNIQESEKSHEYVLRDIFKDIRDIIFIPNIKSVKVFFPGEEPIVCEKEASSDWVVSEPYKHVLDEFEKEIILTECNKYPEKRIPPKYKTFTDTFISFATKKNGNEIEPVQNATVNCYLPTKADFGFPFLMNTDMVPSGDRNQLKTNVQFNLLFSKLAGRYFVKWLNKLLIDGFSPNSVFNLIPNFESAKNGVGKTYAKFIDEFEKGFYQSLNEIPMIPVEGSHDLKLPSEIVWDVTGFSTRGIFDYDKFLSLTKNENKFLPIKTISSNSQLDIILSKNNKSVLFNDTSLLALFDQDIFKKYLLDPIINVKVIEFLLDYPYNGNYLTKDIFIKNNEECLCSSSSLYLDIDEERQYLSAFESQIAFLSLQTRKFLANDSTKECNYLEKIKVFNWATFDAYYSVIRPLFETNIQKEKNLSLLKNEKTNLDLFTFIIKHNIKANCIKEFPILSASNGLIANQWITLSIPCFFYSKETIENRQYGWLDQAWYNILSDKYITGSDEEKVNRKKFFANLGVLDFKRSTFFEKLIKGNVQRIDYINEKTKTNFSLCVELLHFLYSIKDENDIGSFNFFSLPVKGKIKQICYKSGKETTIFLKQDMDDNIVDSWMRKNWIKENWLYILDSKCFDTFDDEKRNDVDQFFKEKFLVKEPSVSNFCEYVVKKNLKEIIDLITPIYKSINETQVDAEKRIKVENANFDFFTFLCDNYQYMFKDGTNPFYNTGYPFVICNLSSISLQPSKFYKYSKDSREAATQAWLPEGIIGAISEKYKDITAGKNIESQLYLFLKAIDFSYSNFIKEDIVKNKQTIISEISTFDLNVAFHNYFKNHRESFIKDEKDALKYFPVFIKSEKGMILATTSFGHHISNEEVEKLIEQGYASVDKLDILPKNYFNDKIGDKEYWIDTLENKEYTFKEIVNWIIEKGEEQIVPNIQEITKNVEFWRLIKSISGSTTKENQKSLTLLRELPIYSKYIKTNETKLQTLAPSLSCYLSDNYFEGSGGIEYMLSEYAKDAYTVDGIYLQNNQKETILSWKKFWENAGFLSSNEALIMDTIIPNLDKEENINVKIPLLLFQNKSLIDKYLTDTENPEVVEKLKNNLNKLHIESNGGMLPISKVIFIRQSEASPFNEPMPYFPLLRQIKNYGKEQILFFKNIGERAGSKVIENYETWLYEKLIQFSNMQIVNNSNESMDKNKIMNDEIHFKFIRDLAKYNKHNTISESLISVIKGIKLFDSDKKLCSVSLLTEGTAYKPYCDFQAYCIKTRYISDEYANYEGIKPLLGLMNIHHTFTDKDTEKLSDRQFAMYFWNSYMAAPQARDTVSKYIQEGFFKELICVPVNNGVKKAEELYNVYDVEGKENLFPYVSSLKDAGNLHPADIFVKFQDKKDKTKEYINPICQLDFLGKLSKNHCFEYLLNAKPNNTAKRRCVLSVLMDYFNNNEISEDDLKAYQNSANAIWLNGQEKPALLSSLYAIGRQPEDKFFLRHFGNDALVINNDTVADENESFERICSDILHLQILHGGNNSDFETIPSDDNVNESERIRQILKQKSLLLASIINGPEGETWKDAYSKYLEKIDELNFIKCEDIKIRCKKVPELERANVADFYLDYGTKTFFYLIDWQDKFVFDSMLDGLIELLQIPGKDDKRMVMRILDKDLSAKVEVKMIENYCVSYLADNDFVILLSKVYPEVAGRLNLQKPVSSTNEDEQKTLVGFSEEQNMLSQDNSAFSEEQERDVNTSVEVDNAKMNDINSQDTSMSSIHQVTEKPSFEVKTSNTENATSTVEQNINIQEQKTKLDHDSNQHSASQTQSQPAESETTASSDQTSIESDHSEPYDTYGEINEQELSKDEDERLYPSDSSLANSSVPSHSGKVYDPDRNGYMGSVDKDYDYQPVGARPYRPRNRKHPKKFTRDEIERLRSHGVPLELESLPATKEELDLLAQCNIRPEQIADTNYLAQLRLYLNLKDEQKEEPEETMENFVRNAGDVTIHKVKGPNGSKYIHTCSAARGVMYVSPSVWNKMVDDKYKICVYLDGYGKNFHYIDKAEDFLHLVEKDDVVIKITGKEKVKVVKALYTGLLKDVKGTAYTLIRVAARTNMDAVFAHYIGAMAEEEDGNDNITEKEFEKY